MKRTIVTLLFCLGFATSALADGRVFPPDNCSTTSPFMAFSAIDGSNTYCTNGQSILSNALPSCGAGQQVIFDGTQFVCQEAQAPTVPTCASGEVLTGSGGNLVCVAQGGGGDTEEPPFDLYNGIHTNVDCINIGGVVRGITGGSYLCEISGTSCPSGWKRLSNWGSTHLTSCMGTVTQCTTASHAFANKASETCTCSSLSPWDSIESATVTAALVTVGCY